MPFERTRSHAIPGIEAVYEEFVHDTGLRHVHVKRPDNERGMAFLFPTPPSNDCGIPHILEHLALCGSQKYPVRDPFFSMYRRSTASFINAMTGEDYTIYPFSTTNENDYWNLMSVYADATFFPNLNKLDFMQEGWREALDDKGDVVIHGVVYNEMLGALNSRDARFEMALDKAWNQGRPTGFMSGGEPLAIPLLSHEDLVAFHQSHYHPSRAIFLTYGDFDPIEAQRRIEEMVLSKQSWEHLSPIPIVAPQPLTGAHVSVPVPQESDGTNEHSLTMLWQIDNDTPEKRLLITAMNLLVLKEGGVISRALEEADFCRPGNMGFSSESGRGFFRLELAGLMEEDLGRARDLVKSTIAELVATPFPAQQVDGALRDFEFHERDVGGKVGGMPYGVGKLYVAGRSMLFGHDGVLAFDNTAGLAQLREHLMTPGFIAEWLNANINREPGLSLHGAPDPHFQSRYAAQLADIAVQRTRALTPERRAQIKEEMKALDARQALPSDFNSLPGLTVADLPLTPRPVLPFDFMAGDQTVPAKLSVRIPSNGQSFVGVSLDVSRVPNEELPWVALLTEMAPSLGAGSRGWAEEAQHRAIQAVSLGSAMSVFSLLTNQSAVTVEVAFDAAGLARDIPGMCHALRDMLYELRLDEKERIGQLISDGVDRISQSISDKGHEWSSLSVSAVASPVGACKAYLNGKVHYAWICAVDAQLKDPARVHEVFDHLRRAHEYLLASPMLLRAASDTPEVPLAVLGSVFPASPGWESFNGTQASRWELAPSVDHVLSGKTSVQYMRQAWRAPTYLEEGAGTLSVLSKVIGMEYLHPVLRERGGAYGASAGYDPSGFFMMATYRDPRLAGSLDDFEAGVKWALGGNITEEMVNSAIIGMCRQTDAPLSPVGAAMDAITNAKQGLGQSDRERNRQEILSATPEKLVEAARHMFAKPALIRAGFINEARASEAIATGLAVVPLVDSVVLEKAHPRPR